jgi:hypothetical protein
MLSHEQFTFGVFLNYTLLFVTKGLPIIIGLISLFRLLARTENYREIQISQCLPNLVIILACIAMLALNWSSTLSLALVCVTIIVMDKLKSE